MRVRRMAAQEASQQLRWRYGDVDDGNFAVRARGIPLLVALLVVLVCFVGVCFYLRWACRRRYNDPEATSSPSSSSSAAAHASSSVNGLDAATIAGLPVTLYRHPAVVSPSPAGDGEDNAAQCSICLGEFAESEKVKTLPRCGHCFHPECVDAWLRSRPSCPLCRGSLLAATTKTQVGSEAV